MNEHELGTEARVLIDSARGHEDPSDILRQRVHTKVLARVAGAVAAGTTAGAATADAAATTTATAAGATGAGATAAGMLNGGLLTNLMIVVGLAGAGAGAALVTRALEPPTPAPVMVTPPVSSPSLVEGPTQGREGSNEKGPSRAGMPEGDIAPAAGSPATTARLVAGSASTPARPSSDPLQDEAALLHRAQERLRGGDADGALQLLDQHERDHGNGALRQERQAAQVFALCQAGRRPQARAAAASFLRESPQSPLAERVRHACAGAD